jgi:hypothetical protein
MSFQPWPRFERELANARHRRAPIVNRLRSEHVIETHGTRIVRVCGPEQGDYANLRKSRLRSLRHSDSPPWKRIEGVPRFALSPGRGWPRRAPGNFLRSPPSTINTASLSTPSCHLALGFGMRPHGSPYMPCRGKSVRPGSGPLLVGATANVIHHNLLGSLVGGGLAVAVAAPLATVSRNMVKAVVDNKK